MAYLDSFNPEKIDSTPEVRQQLRIMRKAIDAGEIGGGGGGAVDSVNGKTGVVVLDAEDVGAATAAQVQSVANDVATNAQDIATLQAAYEGLTQSDIVPLTSLPASGEPNTIYRVAGTDSYTDYMWDGSQFVKLAEYELPNTFESAILNAIYDSNQYIITNEDGFFIVDNDFNIGAKITSSSVEGFENNNYEIIATI